MAVAAYWQKLPIDSGCQIVTMPPVHVATGLRERKKERTRQAMIAAAWELFRKQGYDATMVDDIAERAEVAPRTFFRYFPTKEAVVFHDSAHRFALFQRFLSEGGEGFEAVSRAFLGIARHYAENREDVLEQFKLIESSPALAMRLGEIDTVWVEAIAATLAEGRGRPSERRARILAGAVYGAVRAVLGEWLAEGGRPSLVRLGKEALHIFSDYEA